MMSLVRKLSELRGELFVLETQVKDFISTISKEMMKKYKSMQINPSSTNLTQTGIKLRQPFGEEI